MSPAPKTRRRDQNLENAILSAAWQELQRKGYAALTMESVATKAATSRSVITRRWSNKAVLVAAAVRKKIDQHPYTLPQTGALRSDLELYLEQICQIAPIIRIVFSLLSDAKFRKVYPSPSHLRDALVSDRCDNLTLILQRAADRGEIVAATLTPPIQTLLSDLIGHYILIHNEAPPPALRHAWIDDIFLPLVTKPKASVQ